MKVTVRSIHLLLSVCYFCTDDIWYFAYLFPALFRVKKFTTWIPTRFTRFSVVNFGCPMSNFTHVRVCKIMHLNH